MANGVHDPLMSVDDMERYLAACFPSDPEVAMELDEYAQLLLDGSIPHPEHLVTIVCTHWEAHPAVIYDVLVAAIQSDTIEPVRTECAQNLDMPPLVLESTSPLASSVMTATPPSCLHDGCLALLELQRLQNPTSVLTWLLQSAPDLSTAVDILFRAAPFVQGEALQLLLAVAVRILFGYGNVALTDIGIMGWVDSRSSPVTDRARWSGDLEPQLKHRLEHTLRASCQSSILPEAVQTWTRTYLSSLSAKESAAPPSQLSLADIFSHPTFGNILRISSLLTSCSEHERLATLHPLWPILGNSLGTRNDKVLTVTVIEVLSAAMGMDPAALLELAARHLLPPALHSAAMQSALAEIAHVDGFFALASKHLPYFLLDILVAHSEHEWPQAVAVLPTLHPCFAPLLKWDLWQQAVELAVHLCIERNAAGLAWVRTQTAAAKRPVRVIDYAHATLVVLADALGSQRWQPAFPGPKEAAGVLSWLVRAAGADAGVIAPQIVALAISVANEFPEAALAAWAAVCEVPSNSAGMSLWPAILHAMSASHGVLQLDGQALESAIQAAVKCAAPGELADMPDLEPVQPHNLLETLQHQIGATKAGLSMRARIERMRGQILSPVACVAHAAVRELARLIATLFDQGEALEAPLALIQGLVSVADLHPELQPVVIDCLGIMGVCDFDDGDGCRGGDMEDAALRVCLFGSSTTATATAATTAGASSATELTADRSTIAMTRRASSFLLGSNSGGGGAQMATQRETTIRQDVPALCIVLLRTALIPLFRSSTDTYTQTIVAFAIQKLLKLQRKAILGGLDELDRSTIKHMQDTKYQISYHALAELVYNAEQVVVFTKGMLFSRWACTMVLVLGRHVAAEEPKRVLQALRPLLVPGAESQAVASPLISFLALHLCLGNAKAAIDFLLAEILHVLLHVPTHTSAHAPGLVILDMVQIFSDWRRYEATRSTKRSSPSSTSSSTGSRRANSAITGLVDGFLGQIPCHMLSAAAKVLGMPATAAYYLEVASNGLTGFIPQPPVRGTAEASRLGAKLVQTYELLSPGDRDDYLLGAASLVPPNKQTTEMQAMQHRVAGDWASVLAVYNGSLDETLSAYHGGLYQAYKELGYYEALVDHCQGAAVVHPELEATLSDLQQDACWHIGRWSVLDLALGTTKSSSSVIRQQPSLGHLFSALHASDTNRFLASCTALANKTFDMLRIGHLQSALVQSHAIADLVSFHGTVMPAITTAAGPAAAANADMQVDGGDGTAELTRWYEQCKTRWARTPKSFAVRDELVSVCRASVQLFLDSGTCGPAATTVARIILRNLWLESARLALSERRSHLALSHLLRAAHWHGDDHDGNGNEEMAGAAGICLEHERLMAKWLAVNKSEQAALERIRRLSLPTRQLMAISTTTAFGATHDPADRDFQAARLHLLTARWMAATGSAGSEVIAEQFKTACALKPTWDKAFYYAGRYFYQLARKEGEKPDGGIDFLKQVESLKSSIQLYNRSMQVGPRFVHQALPQVLTSWMELAPVGSQANPDRKAAFEQIHPLIVSLVKRAPSYILMTAVAQVTSRLTHGNGTVFEVLAQILARLLCDYSGPTMWHLIMSFKSSESLRAKRSTEVLERGLSLNGRGLDVLAKQMLRLADQLISVCNHQVPKEQTSFLLSRDFRGLTKARSYDRVSLPITSQLTCTLPPAAAHVTGFDPFSGVVGGGEPVRLAGFVDKVELMTSLVRPKKFAMLGTDGRGWVFLCKPKDDLRKDARLMELTGVINRQLREQRATQGRRLYMRRYAVTPLNEECGLIEWVPHTVAVRSVLRDRYKAKRSQDLYTREIQALFAAPKDQALPNFRKILTMFPPILQDWFVEVFESPAVWFAARLAFTRSCAVVSMVGYMLGLGDRHLENILLDVTTGDAVHVDFNCLFDKGKTFAKPEVVPFRLTQNMVAAFGAVGVEGPFRRSCEVVMQLLRDHRESLMIVLDTFLHDPLIEWKVRKKVVQQQQDSAEDSMRRTAQKHLREIGDRLQGIMATSGLPLGTTGQVDELIRMATAEENLCKMYEGWMPYI
ncbi:hypothetical protein BC828DRAFT_278812 [Blastocladiella britannica]|nr:hypothetical protein BC828DRAFT_278812 [Blastocladiella britannica]